MTWQVLFTPSFGVGRMALALLMPLTVHVLVGNLLEPIVFGRAMELHPVTVLLSLMLWGALWGIPGLILAVPLTAVLKIHLARIDHPLPRLLLRLLDGGLSTRRQQQAAGGGAAAVLAASSPRLSAQLSAKLVAQERHMSHELLPLHGESPHGHGA